MNPNGYVVVFRAENSDDAFARAQETANVFEGVKEGDIVKVKVLEVDLQRQRIALSMRMGDEPKKHDAGTQRGAPLASTTRMRPDRFAPAASSLPSRLASSASSG